MLKYSNYSDQELIDLLNQGLESAFNEIYARYWSGVFLVARNRLKNESEAEEIVQDVFCNLWKKRTTLRIEKNLNAYFSVAVKYEIINRTVKKRHEGVFIKRSVQDTPQSDFSTQETIYFNELQKSLMDSICLLPERCQLTFRLRLENGYSQKQIADRLNISEKTVEAHLTKARKLIRATLGSGFPFYLI